MLSLFAAPLKSSFPSLISTPYLRTQMCYILPIVKCQYSIQLQMGDKMFEFYFSIVWFGEVALDLLSVRYCWSVSYDSLEFAWPFFGQIKSINFWGISFQLDLFIFSDFSPFLSFLSFSSFFFWPVSFLMDGRQSWMRWGQPSCLNIQTSISDLSRRFFSRLVTQIGHRQLHQSFSSALRF